MVTLIADDVSPIRMVYSLLKLTDGMKEVSRLRFALEYAIRLLVCIYIVITSGIGLFWRHGDLNEMVNAFSTFLITVKIFSKVVIVLLYRLEIRQLYDRVEHLHMELRKDEDHRHIILDMERLSKICIMCYTVTLMTFPFYALITNFVLDYKTDYKNLYLSLKLYTFWPITNLWSYTPSTLFIWFLSWVSIMSHISFIALEMVFAFEIQAFSRVLQSRLQTMKQNDENIFGLHRDIIKLVRDYNALFSGQMFWEIMLSSVEPCGYGFTFIKAIRRHDPAVSELFLKLILISTVPFVLCACGQMISTELEKLHEASYMSHWYELSLEMKKKLIQMMIITAKPSVIGYKGIIVFDYSCFFSVAQGIYTYIMMIVNFDTDE